jgi:hypothetical protein
MHRVPILQTNQLFTSKQFRKGRQTMDTRTAIICNHYNDPSMLAKVERYLYQNFTAT